MNPDGDLLLKLLVLAVLIGQGVSVWSSLGRRRQTRVIEPQPLEVVAGKVFATRDEVVALDLQLREVRAQREMDVSSLRAEINKVSVQLAHISANAETTKSAVTIVSSKLDRLIERRFSPDVAATHTPA